MTTFRRHGSFRLSGPPPAPRLNLEAATTEVGKKCPRCRGTGSIMVAGMSAPTTCPRCRGLGREAIR